MSILPEIWKDAPISRPFRDADSRFALEMVTDPVLFFSDPTASLTHVNRAACRQLGYSRQQLRRRSLSTLVPPALRGHLADGVQRVAAGESQVARLHTVFRRRNGTLLPVQCSVRRLENSPTDMFVAVAQPVMNGAEAIGRSIKTVLLDPLTDLPNRAWFLEQLEQDAQRVRRGGYRFAVFFIDIDRFKAINDSFGHSAGDLVLRAFAKRLAKSVRPGDVVARYGGDEFVALLRDIRCGDSISPIAHRIGRQLRASGTRLDETPWQVCVGVSIGVAMSVDGLWSASLMIERADQAMYRAKALGRNGTFIVGRSSNVVTDDDNEGSYPNLA